MINPQNFNFQKKKLFVLSTFGHCGIDHLHSLLDNHKQVIIIPNLSFYRKLEIFEKKKITNLYNKFFISKFIDFILKNRKHTLRYKILKKKHQKKIFKSFVFEYLNTKKNIIPKKDLFEAIHYAFAKINNFTQQKKIIIAHEHVPWNCYKYQDFFPTKYLFIIRDPRASIAGSLRQLKRNKKNLSSYEVDLALNFFWSANLFYNSLEKKKIFVLKNEKMNLDLKKEMKKLSKWLGIHYSNTLLKPTLLGKFWKGESSYISKGDLKKKLPKNYYNINLVNKRWLAVLDDNQIKQLELIFASIFKHFQYWKKFNLSSSEKIIQLSRFILNIDFKDVSTFRNLINLPKLFIRRFCLIFFNKQARKYFLV